MNGLGGVLASRCCERSRAPKQRKGSFLTLRENKTNFTVYLFTEAPEVTGLRANLKVSVSQLAPNRRSSVAFKHGRCVRSRADDGLCGVSSFRFLGGSINDPPAPTSPYLCAICLCQMGGGGSLTHRVGTSQVKRCVLFMRSCVIL